MNDIENILADIIRSLFTNPRQAVRERNIAGMISTGNGYHIYTTPQLEENIIKASRLIYNQDRKFRETHSLKEWQAIFRSEIGRSLPTQIDNKYCFNAEAKKLRRRLEEELTKYYSGYGDLKTPYGCWLFTPVPKKPIEIGPVRFEDRLSWLDRTFGYGVLSKTTHSRLSRAFAGKRLRKRKPSLDQRHEETIRRGISNAPMVCEVTTHGMATKLAYKRSAISANLALTSISLIWQMPSSILNRFRTTLNAEPCISYDFQISPEKQKIVSWNWERVLSPYPIEPHEWETYLQDAECFLKIAGEMIGFWASIRVHTEASPLLRALSQSLFLFWKACRENSDLLSIIEYVAALEALAPGRNKRGILQLIHKRLGLDGNQKLWSGKTLYQTMKEIYKTARSQTIHGPNLKLLHDWSVTRAIAEELARDCLVECMIMAQDNWHDKERNFLLTNPVVL